MDENLQEWNILKIIAPSVTFLGILFYFIPVSRSYFRKGCLILIDAVALGLKLILNSLEPDSVKSYDLQSEILKPRKEKRKKDNYKAKNKFKDNRDWPELKLHQFSRESIGDFKGNRSMMSKKNDVLYLENEGLASNYDQYFPDPNEDIKNSRKQKKRKMKQKLDYRAAEEEEEEEEDNQEIKDKLRKIRKKIVALTDGNKRERQQKEYEALKLIDDLINDRNRKMEYDSLVVDGNRANDSNESWSERKPRSARKESARSRRSNREEIPQADYEDFFSDDSDDFLPPPIINDRVTPIVARAYRWLFGGCPSGSH